MISLALGVLHHKSLKDPPKFTSEVPKTANKSYKEVLLIRQKRPLNNHRDSTNNTRKVKIKGISKTIFISGFQDSTMAKEL